MSAGKYRLVTRSDFDGLASGALQRELRMLDDILFVHPRDLQNGLVAVTDSDIIANLPYHPACHLCFDHHGSEAIRSGHHVRQNYVLDPDADSAARVIYRYYGGAAAFPGIGRDMMEAVDQMRRGPLFTRRNSGARWLGAAELSHGSADWSGAIPELPDLELPADDGPD